MLLPVPVAPAGAAGAPSVVLRVVPAGAVGVFVPAATGTTAPPAPPAELGAQRQAEDNGRWVEQHHRATFDLTLLNAICCTAGGSG